MKARFLAVCLSLCVVAIPVQADNNQSKIPVPQTEISTKIDLNKADLSMLIGSFKGIGKKRAEAIIAYRESHQGFKSIEELAEVKGLGPHFVEVNREKLNEVFTVS